MPFHGIAPRSHYSFTTPYAFTGARYRADERDDRLARGTTVVSSYEDSPTMLLRNPDSERAGVSLRPGTAMKVIDYRSGWHKVETYGDEKVRGWVSMDEGPILRPQLTTPGIDKKYLEYDRVEGRAFTGPVKIEDISQGYLGDCYLVAGLAALAHAAPGVIRDAIRNGKRDGTYEVSIDRIGDNGRNYGERRFILDNWFPTKNDHMLYANGGRKEVARNHIDEFEDYERPLWPSILEKAFATLAGGYAQLDKGGYPDHVFYALTGNKPLNYDLGRINSEESKEAIVALKQGLRRGDPITVETKDRDKVPGIYSNHTYVAVGYTKDKVILRNPHDTRKPLAVSYADFQKAFDSISIAVVD